MTDNLCLTCVWYDGDESDVIQERATLCTKRRKRVYADDTCDEHKAFQPPQKTNAA